MKYFICHLSVIPCRKEPSDASEMVTQMLFGETAVLIEKQKQWLHIKTHYDNYECWIDEKQVLPLTLKEFKQIEQNNHYLVNELVQITQCNNEIIPLTLGAVLPNFSGNTFYFTADKIYNYEGTTGNNSTPQVNKIAEYAFMYLNAPYLWGGRSPFGIDCSGFTQMVFKLCGIKLPRDASQQVMIGEPLNFVEEAQTGDLAFFDNAEGNITHVGIMLDNNKIIHASGKIRIDQLDHYGIFNAEKQKYTHRLRVIKRYF
jgi:cell wall-associated NlpC family hydrolase